MVVEDPVLRSTRHHAGLDPAPDRARGRVVTRVALVVLFSLGLLGASFRSGCAESPFVAQAERVYRAENVAITYSADCDNSFRLLKNTTKAFQRIAPAAYWLATGIHFAKCMAHLPCGFYSVWIKAVNLENGLEVLSKRFVLAENRSPCVEDQIVNGCLTHVLDTEIDEGRPPVLSCPQLDAFNDIRAQRTVFLIPRNPRLPAGEACRAAGRYQREDEDEQGRPIVGVTALVAAFAFILAGLDHGLIRIREGRYLYNCAVGVALVLAGIVAVWITVWALFPLTDVAARLTDSDVWAAHLGACPLSMNTSGRLARTGGGS